MKVIFLDFDGVLNCQKYINNFGSCGICIDPEKMFLLNQIVKETGAKIVLSTSWREHWEKCVDKCDSIGIKINDFFAEYGLEIYDKTSKLNGRREEEIEVFIKENPEIAEFVVLDDCYLSSNLINGHFVKTSYYGNGLDAESTLNAISILNEGEG